MSESGRKPAARVVCRSRRFPVQGGHAGGRTGIVADGVYGLDLNVSDRDRDVDELIATAGTFGFGAPLDCRGDRITADGKTFRFSDVDFRRSSPQSGASPCFASIPASAGALLNLSAFSDGTIQPGVAFGTAASGIRPDNADYAGLDAFVLVDRADTPRYAPRDGQGSPGRDSGSRTNDRRRRIARRESKSRPDPQADRHRPA